MRASLCGYLTGGEGRDATPSALACTARPPPHAKVRARPGPGSRAPGARAGRMPSRPRGFILSVSCLRAVLSSWCWAGLGVSEPVGRAGCSQLCCSTATPAFRGTHAPGARFRAVRWRLGKRVPASAPARVPKVVFSFLLFSIPNYRRWSARVYFSSHELGQLGHRSGRRSHDLIAPKRHNITDPGTWWGSGASG